MVFIRIQKGAAGSAPAMAAGLGALEEVLSPSASRARELLEADHERVVAAPSPGDRLLDDGVVVIPSPAARER